MYCFWESSCTFEYRLCMLIMYLACSHCDKCWEIELLLLLLLILVQGLPCSVSRVERHLSVLPIYLELQPGQVNWYTRLLLERLGTLSLFETKYDIFLVLYITMKLIGCLRQRWIFWSKVRTRFSPWLPRYGRRIHIFGRISSSVKKNIHKRISSSVSSF